MAARPLFLKLRPNVHQYVAVLVIAPAIPSTTPEIIKITIFHDLLIAGVEKRFRQLRVSAATGVDAPGHNGFTHPLPVTAKTLPAFAAQFAGLSW